MSPEILEKIQRAVEFDRRGNSKALELAIDSGNDDVWEAILSVQTLRPEMVDRVYAEKVVNDLGLASVIRHPNMSRLVMKHIVKMQVPRQVAQLLQVRPEIRYQQWFVAEVGTNSAVQATLRANAAMPSLSPEDVENLPASVAAQYVTAQTPPLVLCQILLDHKQDGQIRQGVIDQLHYRLGSLPFTPLVNAALMDSFKHETDDSYRALYTEILREITPQGWS